MSDSPDYTAEIQALEQLINTANKSVSADGLAVTIDLEFAMKRLTALRRLQGDDARMVRPRVTSISLGGAW